MSGRFAAIDIRKKALGITKPAHSLAVAGYGNLPPVWFPGVAYIRLCSAVLSPSAAMIAPPKKRRSQFRSTNTASAFDPRLVRPMVKTPLVMSQDATLSKIGKECGATVSEMRQDCGGCRFDTGFSVHQGQNKSFVTPNTISDRTSDKPMARRMFSTLSDGALPVTASHA